MTRIALLLCFVGAAAPAFAAPNPATWRAKGVYLVGRICLEDFTECKTVAITAPEGLLAQSHSIADCTRRAKERMDGFHMRRNGMTLHESYKCSAGPLKGFERLIQD